MNIKKNNSRKLSDADEEQAVRTLTKYYPLNEETNAFEITLRYEKASDLFDASAGTLTPKISEEVTDHMSDLLEDIPKGYKADFSIRVDDYEGYSSGLLMAGINDALFFRHRRFFRDMIQKGMTTGILLLAGVVMILVLTIGKQIGWWGGDDTVSEILTYMLDTLGCVLIWEGLYNALVEKPEAFVFEQTISRKVRSISFYQADEGSAAASESIESIAALTSSNRKKLRTKRLLLLSGFALICLAIAWVLQTLGIIIKPENFGEKVTEELILDMLVAPLIGAVGILSLRAYESKLPNTPYTSLFAAIILYPIVNAFLILFGAKGNLAPTETILAVSVILAGLTFIVAYTTNYIQHELDIRQHHLRAESDTALRQQKK